MKWKKSSAQLIAAFAAALPDDARAERRQMFGYPCAFANGNMFTGLHEENWVVRLPDAQRAQLLGEKGAEPFAPMGRTMREYVVLPKLMHTRPAVVRQWVALGFAYGLTLPKKAKAAPKAKATKKSRVNS